MPVDFNFTQRMLRNLVIYNPDTGLFRCATTGKLLGTYDNGYYKFQLKKTRLFAHQWAWLYMYGEITDLVIDHINGDKSDNRLCNLRAVDLKTNAQNIRSTAKRSKLKLGVSRNGKKFRAHLYINGKLTALGTFDTEEAAHQAYLENKRKYHPGFNL